MSAPLNSTRLTDSRGSASRNGSLLRCGRSTSFWMTDPTPPFAAERALLHSRAVVGALGSRSLRASARYRGRKRYPMSGIIVLAAGRARLGQWPKQTHPEARQETPTSAISTIGFQLRQRLGAAERPRGRSGGVLPSPMTGRMSFPSPRPSCALSRAISETCWIRYLGHALDVERSKP